MDRMHYQQLGRRSYRESLRCLENDVEHANALAATIPRAKGGALLQMKLVYSRLAPYILFLIQWIDCSPMSFLAHYLNIASIVINKVYTEGRRRISKSARKATIKEFYAVILPSLQQLHIAERDGDNVEDPIPRSISRKRVGRDGKSTHTDSERDEECGICLVPSTKIVLPECCHAMCIKCYHKWSIRSESCPFCRGSLRRVNSSDLWVLTSEDDVVDPETILSEDSKRFYQYVENLPKDSSDALFLMYCEYMT